MSAASSLLERHASAWMHDKWYSRAWLIWPQLIALVLIAYMFTRQQIPEAPPVQADWVHPTDMKARMAAVATLRDQAKTDTKAEALLLQRAGAGDPVAQYAAATLFDPILDRPKASLERTKEAIAWYRKAAEHNFPPAQSNLGLLLAYEQFGIAPDYPEAYMWLERAAPSMPAAQRELGFLFRNGRGVPADPNKGMQMIQSAADRGDAGAQAFIADAFDRGTDGLSVDHHQAVLLYQKAALQDLPYAERQLAIHLEKGEGIEGDQEKATYWFKRAAEHGDKFAKARLATPTKPPPTAPSITPYSFAPLQQR
jgi:TPR repeat protein